MARLFYLLLLYCCTIVNASPTKTHCEKSLFQCDNGRCVSFSFVCDGEDECGDLSDEKDCLDFKLPSVNCTEEEYKCADNTCIPIEKFCDARNDCFDKSDEYPDCVKDKKCKNFKCSNGYCVRMEWICDGMDDCPDGSDEINCDGSHTPPKECTNEIDRYLCANGRCISLSQTCNGKDDCGDGSDEDVDKCKKSEELCSHVEKCAHVCRRTPRGPTCSCHPGYKLINNITCTDINECEIFGSCYQHCTNNAGSYVCSCEAGYNLEEDGRSCKADGGEALLFLASKTQIRGYYISSELYYPVLTNLSHAVAVNVDANYVYWSDLTEGREAIMKSALDGSSQQTIAFTGIRSPEGVAVDWVTGNIYFTDYGFQHIGVCDSNGTYCTVLIYEHTEKPRAIVLSPKSGIMYWSDWGQKPQIAMASMDGKNMVTLVEKDIEWPNGLTIDYSNNRLYWIDAQLKIIESIRLDGKDRRRILSDIIKRPFSIAVFENNLYWTEWSTNTIESCDKFTGKDWKILLHANSVPYDIHIYHSVLKPKISNPCSDAPCSEMCLLNSNNSYTCVCTMSKVLGIDGHTCRASKKIEHLMIATGSTLIEYFHEVLGKPKLSTSMTMKHITALAYDSLTGDVFVNDQLTNKIYRYNVNTGVFNTLLTVPNEMLGGMDFDFLGNNLFWTDMEHRSIEVHSLDTKGKTVFYFYDEPHDIIVAPLDGFIYVVLRTGDTYCIDRMQMDGLGTREHIERNLWGPKISLAYDSEPQRLYWADQGSGRIDLFANKDYGKYLFRTGLKEPMSLAILGDNVFWTQKGSDTLYWTSKTKDLYYIGQHTLQVQEKIESLNLVAMPAVYYDNGEHSCRKNNGYCSHVCLTTQYHYHICACPPGMMLMSDNRTCTIQSVCAEDEIKCSEHNVCIKLKQKCDNVVDCPNGEDEINNCKENAEECGKNEFRCKNGECISLENRCNSRYDCKDHSDEENCEAAKCKPDEFQCHEGGCISQYLVCNQFADCPDFSDELNCDSHTCSSNDFTCENSECIPNTWVCDGTPDCENGLDEQGDQCIHKTCKDDMYRCKNSKCLDRMLLCNGFDDCGDNSDEDHCSHSIVANCTKNEYRCRGTNICLPQSKRCNGVQDCPKNDDEYVCPNCQHDEFACENNKCIPLAWMCDKSDDCGDKSDEKYCSGERMRSRNVTSTNNCKEFRCTDGTCLAYNDVCNGYPDCMDGSDENNKCAMACTTSNPCQNVCYKTPMGPVCGCSTGYRLASDGVSCMDVNECEEDLCSQICHNTRGSFVCSCESGYILQKDKMSCKAAGSRMEIITAAGNDIRKNTPTLSSIEVIHHDPNFENYEIDVNARENTVYLSNDLVGTITKINLETKDKKVLQNVGRPGAIAIDWATDNIYFYNDERPYAIKACNLEQEKCARVLLVNGTAKVQSINVDPTQGWLFWSQTDWLVLDHPKSQIYRSSMTGTNPTAIVTRNLGVVQKLTTDHRKSRLYWCDTQLSVIESSNFDGTDRKVFLKTEFQPLDINVYEDSIYWLLSNTGNIRKCKLHGDKSCQTIFSSQIVTKHFAILHNTRQPFVPNGCQNQTCAYMCLQSESNYLCICPNGRPTGNEVDCTDDSNVKISSYVSSGQKKVNVRQDSGMITGIIVAVVGILAVLSGYCYYQQLRTSPTKKNDLSIHFQNPSYDQRRRSSEVLASFNCIVSNLPPGEHEYINPIINISAKIDDPIKDTRKKIEVQYSDHSEGESEDSRYTANTKLLRETESFK